MEMFQKGSESRMKELLLAKFGTIWASEEIITIKWLQNSK